MTVARFAVAVTVAPRASRAGRDVRRETLSSGPTTRQSLSLEAHLPDLARPHSSESTPIALALTRFFLSSQFDNQGLLFGALADLSALPQTQPRADAHRRRDELLLLGGRVLDAVSAHLVRDDDGALSEPISFEMRHPTRCDESHDPAQPLGGGDPFSFKAVFFNQLPRFVEAAAGVLSAAPLERARALTAASAAAAWRSRALRPFLDATSVVSTPSTRRARHQSLRGIGERRPPKKRSASTRAWMGGLRPWRSPHLPQSIGSPRQGGEHVHMGPVD